MESDIPKRIDTNTDSEGSKPEKEQGTSIIPKALEYYDLLQDKLDILYKKTKEIETLDSIYDQEANVMIFKDKNGTEIFRSEYEVLGTYFSESKSWVWAWNLPHLTKNKIKICRDIWNYGVDLPPTKENHSTKVHLTTSRFTIVDPHQIEIYTALASYLSHRYIYKQQVDYLEYYFFLVGLDPTKEISLKQSNYLKPSSKKDYTEVNKISRESKKKKSKRKKSKTIKL